MVTMSKTSTAVEICYDERTCGIRKLHRGPGVERTITVVPQDEQFRRIRITNEIERQITVQIGSNR